MDPYNELIRLGHYISDAADLLDQAVRHSADLIGDDPEQGLDGWPEMEALCNRLDELRKAVAVLPGPAIAEAIKNAHEYLDHLSDLADGASY